MGKFALVFLGLLLAVSFAFTHDTAVRGVQATSVRSTPTPAPSVAPTIKEEDDRIVKSILELVNLDVRVVDRNGRPVNDLKQSDFKVFEEGAAAVDRVLFQIRSSDELHACR